MLKYVLALLFGSGLLACATNQPVSHPQHSNPKRTTASLETMKEKKMPGLYVPARIVCENKKLAYSIDILNIKLKITDFSKDPKGPEFERNVAVTHFENGRRFNDSFIYFIADGKKMALAGQGENFDEWDMWTNGKLFDGGCSAVSYDYYDAF
jgi:hypothetical protein